MREHHPPRRSADPVGPPRSRRRAGALAVSILSATSLALSGCFDQPLIPDFESDGRVSISNDEGALGDRVSCPNEPVPIESSAPGADGPLGAPAMAPSSITLTLVGDILPPTISGQLVQATSVSRNGLGRGNDRAIVSYNVRGSVALGALDYFDDLDRRRPRLRSSVQFADADANAVFTDGDWAYASTASSDVTLAFPAVLERIEIQGNRFRTGNNDRVELTSFAATSAVSTGNVVYVTTGDDGGIFAFDESDLSLLGEYPLDDARWVAWDEPNQRIVVVQGTPGRVAVFAEGSFPGGSMTLLGTYPFPGADVPESKSTVEVLGGKAFIAAGPEGVQVMCLANGQIVGSVPRPDPSSLGLSPSVVVTNSVTVEDDLMFISNGEAGVYAAAGAQSFESSGCGAQQIDVLGRLRFSSLQSANHVVISRDLLFVAAGLGGVKVVDVNTR